MKSLYLVKDLARETGHSTNTIKFYLREGLIREFARTPYTNFRLFDRATLRRLGSIRSLRKEGVSLKKIRTKICKEGHN